MRPNGLLRQLLPRNIIAFEGRGSGKVALTFDDGPTPKVTEQILSALAARGHSATFFVLGMRAESHPSLLRKIHDSGCELGNHSFSHRRLPAMRLSEIGAEYSPTDRMIAQLVGSARAAIRPPGGEMTLRGMIYFLMARRQVVLWSVLVPGEEHSTSQESVAAIDAASIRAGDIVLLHDEFSTGDAIDGILDLLESKGLRSVTVSELLDRSLWWKALVDWAFRWLRWVALGGRAARR